jgi:alkanesulfonate monooxygenase SsuD/methylene tetrahydromethanopterin reductase-like flavin-dependent oxidoreductase (luciferase family)
LIVDQHGARGLAQTRPRADNGLGVVLKGLAPSELLRLAQDAQRSRFRSAWFAEITFGDAITPAAAAAVGTGRIQLVPSIVGIWSRSPVAAALTASSLDDLSGGRLRFGSGSRRTRTSRNGMGEHLSARSARCAST